jgi:hypothetical protein
MRFRSLILVFLCSLFFSGCSVTHKAVATADVAAAGNDRYHTLVQKAFDGTADMDEDGLLPIKADEWKAAPKSVRVLVDRLLNGLNTNRFAFYSIKFQLGEGADPDTLGLEPISPPEVPDENAGLLDGPGDGQ